jgi:hypothetical protein
VKLHQCSTGRASPLLKPGSRGRPLPTREGLASDVRTVGLQFQSLIETMFTLAAEGKTNRKGLPNPSRLAVIADAHFDTVQLPCRPPSCNKPHSRPPHRSAVSSDTKPTPRIPPASPDRTHPPTGPTTAAAPDSHEHSRTTAKTPAGDAVRPSARDCLTDAGARGLCVSSADSSASPSDVGASYHHADASHRPCIARDRRTA